MSDDTPTIRDEPIQQGERIPAVQLRHLVDGNMRDIDTAELLRGGTTVLFGVPGAFTPTCSGRHLPGFVAQAGALKDKGVARIVCLSVNDPFVMRAWGEDQTPSELTSKCSRIRVERNPSRGEGARTSPGSSSCSMRVNARSWGTNGR